MPVYDSCAGQLSCLFFIVVSCLFLFVGDLGSLTLLWMTEIGFSAHFL